ncbi:hypothetical protein HRbin35_00058 [bacterium HR35]|nr:hypothetical protein HRbin35_00058 [bacterium HR35]
MSWLMEKKYILIVLFLLFLGLVLIKQTKIRAEIAYFYPQSCLGSFINPEKAQGKPEVDNPDLINESNSAVYLGGFKEIYCGNFQGPEVQGEIKKITLHFNWIVTKERREAVLTEPTSTNDSNILEKIIPPKTIEIIPATPTTETAPLPNTTPTPEATSTPQSSFNTDSRGLLLHGYTRKLFNLDKNYLDILFWWKTTFAEEMATPIESTTPTTLTTTPSEAQNQSTETQSIIITTTPTSTENQTETTSSTTSTEALTTPTTSETTSLTTSTPPKTLFEVHYTLDGENWTYLGDIKTQTNADNTQTNADNYFIPDVSFEIPVNNWLDISKIQIKINSLPDTDYYLYLESMWFEVEYELPQATSTISEITNFVGGTISSLTENFSNDTSTLSETSTSYGEDDEEILTPTNLENATPTPHYLLLNKENILKK